MPPSPLAAIYVDMKPSALGKLLWDYCSTSQQCRLLWAHQTCPLFPTLRLGIIKSKSWSSFKMLNALCPWYIKDLLRLWIEECDSFTAQLFWHHRSTIRGVSARARFLGGWCMERLNFPRSDKAHHKPCTEHKVYFFDLAFCDINIQQCVHV